MSRPSKPFSIRLMLERELKSIDRRLEALAEQRSLVASELENVLAVEVETGSPLVFDSVVEE